MSTYLQARCFPSFPQWWDCGRTFERESRDISCGGQVTQRRQRKSLFFFSLRILLIMNHIQMCATETAKLQCLKISWLAWRYLLGCGRRRRGESEQSHRNAAPRGFHTTCVGAALCKSKEKMPSERNTALWASCMQIHLCTHLCWNTDIDTDH